MTSQEQKNPQSVEHDIPDTEVINMSVASPVFVDATGRRRRLLRRIAYAFGGVCMMYGGLICVSLAGGPVRSSAILPLPEFAGRHAKPAVAPPEPTPEPAATAPRTQRMVEALPRRGVPVTRTSAARRSTPVTVRVSATATPKPSPSPSVSTSRPTESTTAPTSSGSPPTSGSAAPPTGGTGGTGGSSTGTGGAGGGTSTGTGTAGGTGGGSVEPVPPAPPAIDDDPPDVGSSPEPTPDPNPESESVPETGTPEVPA